MNCVPVGCRPRVDDFSRTGSREFGPWGRVRGSVARVCSVNALLGEATTPCADAVMIKAS